MNPTANRLDPLPKLGLTGAGGAGVNMKDAEGGIHLRVPLPQFNYLLANRWPDQPGFYPVFPIKPLPQGAGGGGPVGTPIDSG